MSKISPKDAMAIAASLTCSSAYRVEVYQHSKLRVTGPIGDFWFAEHYEGRFMRWVTFGKAYKSFRKAHKHALAHAGAGSAEAGK